MAEVLVLHLDRLKTPIGEMALLADEEGRLRVTGWWDRDEGEDRMLAGLRARHGREVRAVRQRNPSGLTEAMAAYFEGDVGVIDRLPVAAEGTPFQHEVWDALRRIPCGTTVTYSEIAHRIGRPRAVRAVGLANGQNPVGVVVPCHRVIGADGTLTGYGGGLDRKRWLLAHEAAARPGPLFEGPLP
jgi:methylated-DNA-[protein]-cysteine S-methyltransferase